MSGSFCKEMVTFEPVRMVRLPQPAFMETGPNMLELSNLDLLYDYFNAVALFFDAKLLGAMPDERWQSRTVDKVDATNYSYSTPSHKDPANILHSALQELLVHYPAAAGRIHFNDTNGRYEVKFMPCTSSSCSATLIDDEALPYGVPFIIAHANTALAELGDVSVPHPSLDVLYPSIRKQNQNNHTPLPVAAIQVTTFTCGSFTLALMVSHLVMDAYSAATWLKNLCSIAKGEGLAAPMDVTNRREIVKPRVPPSPKGRHPHICSRKREEAHVTKELLYGVATRFSFSATSLETLRSSASDPHAKLCSRFQALVALLWIIRAKCLAKSGASPSLELPLRFPINLRGRSELPAFTQSYMGCALLQCSVLATVQELCQNTLAYVVQKVGSSTIRGLQMQERLQSEIDTIELHLQNGQIPYIDHAVLGMPSLVNLPFYDADCGWGRPIYCARPSRQLGHRMIILDDPRTQAWNVLAVLSSQEEHDIFQEEVAKYIGEVKLGQQDVAG